LPLWGVLLAMLVLVRVREGRRSRRRGGKGRSRICLTLHRYRSGGGGGCIGFLLQLLLPPNPLFKRDPSLKLSCFSLFHSPHKLTCPLIFSRKN
ncbi:hypothetical protein HC762_01695, partial [bacterium]|nr:hypothetical protein [bacterium]